MVSPSYTALDEEFHRTAQCAVQYMNGVQYHNVPHHTKEDTGHPYHDGDVVTVELDSAAHTLRWSKGPDDVPCTVSCPGATQLKCAVVLKRSSAVSIVEVE